MTRPVLSQVATCVGVVTFGVLLYLPCAGSYGLWDPWETHYGEVARQMTERGDHISLWWPGSARESAVFQTKPVLSFWLMSASMRLFGVGLPGGAPGEMALGTRAEWAARTPFCVLAALGLLAVYLRHGQRWFGLGLALLACVLVAAPWHHAMVIRHGSQWWSEMFGDNHWRRLVLGRHGDRGTFEYFLRELGYGVLPWLPVLPAAIAAALRAGGKEDRHLAAQLGLVWFICTYAVVSLSMTKFHHYVLPAIPGLGIVAGCHLDDLLAGRRRAGAGIALVGLPLLGLVARDLTVTASAAQRFLWLFSYDYVHNPQGRAWPEALDFRPALLGLVAATALASIALSWRWMRRPGLAALGATAVALALWLLDGFMPRVAPFWSQKPLVAAYYRDRRSPEERLVAYRLFWRGETFYTKNAIFSGPDEERTVFDSDGPEADDRLRAWLSGRRGQRQYFLFETAREAQLRALLPPEAKPAFEILPGRHTKFALARVQL